VVSGRLSNHLQAVGVEGARRCAAGQDPVYNALRIAVASIGGPVAPARPDLWAGEKCRPAGLLPALAVTGTLLMSTGLGCSDLERLAAHARNELAPEETAALDRHLTDCRPCLDRYVELGKRPLVPDIPDCHIVKEIGRGRFGVVYKAWWLKDKPRIVALKILSGAGEMEKHRFDREIAVLKKIDSPLIVKCLDSDTAGDTRYYVMDFVEGVHLDKYLAFSTHDLNEKLPVFQRVCRAVGDAHAAGVVHRDLKPSNILIDADGQPHILDFGICGVEKADWSSWDRSTITHAGDIMGTLKYMSPEQAWAGVAGPIGEPSDMWALGVMLYEIATGGDYPYPLGATVDKPAHEALLERIRKQLPRLPRLESVPRGRDLEILLERCLAWEPDRRLKSPRQLADDLERYCAGRRIKTKPLRIPYRLKRLAVGVATRSRWTFSAIFIATLGVILWFATYLFNVGWRVSGLLPQGQQAPSTMAVGSGQVPNDILIVGVFDDTIDAVVKFAGDRQIEGVTTDWRSWRAVHGFLMERLARAGPHVVSWDYYFRSTQPADAQLVAGVTSLEEAGVPVVLAALSYRQDGTPDLSPTITGPLGEGLRHGAIVARDMVRRPGEFVMAIKPDENTIVPSLVLATAAAVVHPDARLDLDWRGRRKRIDLLYQTEPGRYLRQRDRIELTRTYPADRRQKLVNRGDLLAFSAFPLERPEHWERRTVPYQTLLTCSDEDLQDLVMGKIVIIGDLRTAPFGVAADRHRVKYGQTIVDDVPGCYLLANATAGLLQGRILRSAFPPPMTTFAAMLLLAAVGCLLPINLATRKVLEQPRYRRVLWMVVLGLSATCFVVMCLTKGYVSVNLGMAGFALLTPMAGSFWVEFARNRHRILDRRRQSTEELRLGTDGTITLTPRRRTSHQEAG
jgi:CHASE2 domain-containing sensor protein